MFGGGGLGSFHADVLAATPVGADAISRLTEEIKSRAVGSIKQGNLPEAIALYTKAIEIQTESDPASLPVSAILYANRSMCHLKMNAAQDAQRDAQISIEKDATYAKAYYRNGVALIALKKYSFARETLSAGLAIKPDDKELREHLQKIASLQDDTAATSGSVSASIITKADAPKTTQPKVAASSAPKMPSAAVAEVDDDVDASVAKSGGALRGYKTTSDGRKTTFFNHELDEETKNLIGSIAPKKLEESNVSVTAASGTTSAWNTAGTFESVNWTKWATERLQEMLLAVTVSEAGGCVVTVTEAKLEGDAEIVSNRGKTKAIFDFVLSLKWKIAQGSETCQGSMEIHDVTADGDFEVVETKADTASSLPELLKLVKQGNSSFQKAIFATLNAFSADFKSKINTA